MHVNHAEVSGIKVALGLPPSVGVAMIIALDVNNPNSYDVAIRAVRGSVYLANKWQLPVDFQPGGEGVWLRSNGITQVRVPTVVPAGVAAAILAESLMTPQIPYRFQGRADVTATRTFALEKDDYSVDESGFVSRQQIEAATRSFLASQPTAPWPRPPPCTTSSWR